MLGEDFEEEEQNDDINHNNVFKKKKNNKKEYLEYSQKKLKDGSKKEKEKKQHNKKNVCESCKALKQKINELEQLNEEMLKIKEKLSKKNEELSQKNDELNKSINILSKKNNELKEENNKLINKNNELIEEKNGYKTEISGLKKELIVKINELSSITKEKEKLSNSNNNSGGSSINKKETKNSTVNVDIMSLNSDSNSNKKEDINNINRYCSIEDFNELKIIVEELSLKVNELEKWKKNILLNDITKSVRKSVDRKITSVEKSDKTSSRHRGKRNKKKIESIDKLSQSLIIKQNKIIDNNVGTNSINGNNYNESKNINDSSNKMNKSFSKNKIKNNEIEKKNNKKFNSKIITNVEDLDLIARGLVKDELDNLKNLRVGYKLIYRATENGEDAKDFHEKCDDFEGTLTLIKTKEDKIFGGYTSLSWDPENESEKKDELAFVFSLNLGKLYFESDKKDFSIFCDRYKGPCFVGMFSIQEKILSSKSYINPWGIQCFSGEKSPFEINDGKTEFDIEELEVFQVIVKRN
jgi:hypothetical protein